MFRFYYDPVLGLQYSYLYDNSVIQIGLVSIPEGYDIEELNYLLKSKGVLMVDSSVEIKTIEQELIITEEYKPYR